MASFPLESNNANAPIPRIGTSEQISANVTKTAFESNYLQVRRTSSRVRKAFSLDYNNITMAEYQILEDFFVQYVGNTFKFLHPISNIEYTVTFKDPTLDKSYVAYGIYNTKIALESI